ncbi:MAG: hypothetical protein GX749_08040 [Ruminococcaceae bacterium]|nr:hypothetical protein [Oscillospiraceae bacterium]
MQTKLKCRGVDYCESSKGALVYFKIKSERIQGACLMASINACGRSEPTFMLFSGCHDLSLIEELRAAEEDTRAAVIEIARLSSIDSNDEDELQDFLLQLEAAARRLVPIHVWQKIKAMRKPEERYCC